MRTKRSPRSALLLAAVSGLSVIGCTTIPAPQSAAERPAATSVQASIVGPVLDLAEVDQVPKARDQPPPYYPYELRQVGLRGEVVIGFVVDTEGNTREVQVLKANDPRFGAAAAESVSQWKFVPGRKAGQLVNVRMSVPIVFSFNQG